MEESIIYELKAIDGKLTLPDIPHGSLAFTKFQAMSTLVLENCMNRNSIRAGKYAFSIHNGQWVCWEERFPSGYMITSFHSDINVSDEETIYNMGEIKKGIMEEPRELTEEEINRMSKLWGHLAESYAGGAKWAKRRCDEYYSSKIKALEEENKKLKDQDIFATKAWEQLRKENREFKEENRKLKEAIVDLESTIDGFHIDNAGEDI